MFFNGLDMTEILQLQVPGKIPVSQNQRDKWHWAKRHKESKSWKKQIALAKLVAGCRGEPKYSQVDIKIQRHCVRSIKDQDNLWGGCKPILDALVSEGIISDDGRDNIRHREIWQTHCSHKKYQGTVITITPLSNSHAHQAVLSDG